MKLRMRPVGPRLASSFAQPAAGLRDEVQGDQRVEELRNLSSIIIRTRPLGEGGRIPPTTFFTSSFCLNGAPRRAIKRSHENGTLAEGTYEN